MYDARARFYDPFTGNFTQPDSLVPEPYHPISLNRYAYTYNSPVNFTDSTGHFIDTLWDAFDLGANLRNCLGDTDSLSCYMVPVAAAAMMVPGATGGIGRISKAHIEYVENLLSRSGRVSKSQIGEVAEALRRYEHVDDDLGHFVQARHGTANSEFNCIGCVLYEYYQFRGMEPLVKTRQTMPWDADGIDEFLGYLSKGGPDKVENVLQNSQSFRALA